MQYGEQYFVRRNDVDEDVWTVTSKIYFDFVPFLGNTCINAEIVAYTLSKEKPRAEFSMYHKKFLD